MLTPINEKIYIYIYNALEEAYFIQVLLGPSGAQGAIQGIQARAIWVLTLYYLASQVQ